MKRHDDFDRVMDFDRSFFGYPDKFWSEQPLWWLRGIAKVILYAGLLLFLLEIRLPKSGLLTFTFLANTILLVPSLWMPFHRYGPDFTAYVNQAGQFWAGQTNFLKISSVQGQCFYPAGHLFHYLPAYWLFMWTENAEYIWKFFHFLLHSAI